ncbi:MAG: hypothetical protein K8I60_03095 [Anaerolineae bacterium]|nr:hypothetical protein [Anaerolineae bacterium]
MEQALVGLLPQLGLAAVILYLLMDEKKARQKLEDKITSILDELMDASRPVKPSGM